VSDGDGDDDDDVHDVHDDDNKQLHKKNYLLLEIMTKHK
jgi:hypothetical protein